jgi:hypothetical protein
MDVRESALPQALQDALAAKNVGATGVARMVIRGLLELGDSAAMRDAVAYLTARLTGYAPLWHIGRAVRGPHPTHALEAIRTELDRAVEQSVAAAAGWVTARNGRPTVAPSSSVVRQVLARLGGDVPPAAATVALAGADAIGPDAVLNIVGTRALAAQFPTLVVTTSLKLVPDDVFDGLGAPVFERIPLRAFAGIVLDGEVLPPAVAGRRAEQLR